MSIETEATSAMFSAAAVATVTAMRTKCVGPEVCGVGGVILSGKL